MLSTCTRWSRRAQKKIIEYFYSMIQIQLVIRPILRYPGLLQLLFRATWCYASGFNVGTPLKKFLA